jgi:DNA-binding HxlR family transcriptional regulator
MSDSNSKRCKACNEVKPLSNYWNHPSSIDGLQYKCIECMKLEVRGKTRPPLSTDQIKLLISMLDLLPDTVKNTSWIDEERIKLLNPGMRNVGRLVTRGIVEKETLWSPTRDTTDKIYRLTEKGRTIAKGMEALSTLEKKTGEVA